MMPKVNLNCLIFELTWMVFFYRRHEFSDGNNEESSRISNRTSHAVMFTRVADLFTETCRTGFH